MTTTPKSLDLRGMTEGARDAAVNEAVALLAGWYPATHVIHGGLVFAMDERWVYPEDLPPFATSCDAVKPLEDTLGKNGESYEYWKHLCEQCHVAWDGNCMWVAVFATAYQRCLALLKADGWEILT